MDQTADAADAETTPDTPTFRGCVVCYSAEWAYYGAKTGLRTLRRSTADPE